MSETVTVVNLLSLSFTGTTWINIVLGSHPDALAMGPPDRFDELWRSQPEKLCLLHRDSCAFWPAFCRSYDPGENFFVQLAAFAGKRVIVINNPIPTGFGRELDDPRIDERRVYVARDGRAVSASYARRFEKPYEAVVRDWYAPAAGAFPVASPPAGSIALRYERLVVEPATELRRLSEHVGIEYGVDALRYWTFEHHPLAGNQGLIALLQMHNDMPAREDTEGLEHYLEHHRREQDNPGQPVLDERWKEQLTRRDRFVFDQLCGEVNADVGYERDAFTDEECALWGRVEPLPKPPRIEVMRRLVGRARRVIGRLRPARADARRASRAAEGIRDDLRAIERHAVEADLEQLAQTARHYAQPGIVESYLAVLEPGLMKHVGRFERSTGLDYGCWFGLSTLMLRRLGAARVVGMDVIDRFIEQARGWREALGLGGVDFELIADGQHGCIPADEDAFDWAIANDVFSNALPDRWPRMLEDLHRVIRPGGLFLFKETNNARHEGTAERLRSIYDDHEIGDGTAEAPRGYYQVARANWIGQHFPDLDAARCAELAAETAYRWGPEIVEYVESRLAGHAVEPSRAEGGSLRVPLRPWDGHSISAVTDPVEFVDMMVAAGFDAELRLSLEGPAVGRSDDLSTSGVFYILARPARSVVPVPSP